MKSTISSHVIITIGDISKNSKIFVAGHRGLVGSAVVRRLKIQGFKNILTISKKCLLARA